MTPLHLYLSIVCTGAGVVGLWCVAAEARVRREYRRDREARARIAARREYVA